jgi:hypothetical protein
MKVELGIRVLSFKVRSSIYKKMTFRKTSFFFAKKVKIKIELSINIGQNGEIIMKNMVIWEQLRQVRK